MQHRHPVGHKLPALKDAGQADRFRRKVLARSAAESVFSKGSEQANELEILCSMATQPGACCSWNLEADIASLQRCCSGL